MATSKLSDAEKRKRADERATAAAAAKAAKSDDPKAMQAAAAALVGHAPLEPEAKGRSNRTVTVACKMPHGLIIQMQAKKVEHEPVLGGGMRAVDRYRQVGQQFKVHGTLAKTGQRAPHVLDDSGGYAITRGIPLDVWENFMHHNEESLFVTNGLIYGDEKDDKVLGWAREHASVMTNMEPLNVSLVAAADGSKRIADKRARSVAPAVTDGKIEMAS
jgi:hypothetical protein